MSSRDEQEEKTEETKMYKLTQDSHLGGISIWIDENCLVEFNVEIFSEVSAVMGLTTARIFRTSKIGSLNEPGLCSLLFFDRWNLH